MKVSFAVSDADMPRTVYYDLFATAVRRNARFTDDSAEADICLPAEDMALETNWPRFGDPASAFIRGTMDTDKLDSYANALTKLESKLCIINMHPFIRWPQLMAERANVVVADINLAQWEQFISPRTISMPALPVAAGPAIIANKSILASFRGVASHPCRTQLHALHDGADIRCELVERANHAGRIDAIAGKTDEAYTTLLAASIFAFVPRGDAMFSYRLLEAMSFGCIPVVLSDNWVLPFSRTIDWSRIALHPGENDIASLPALLRAVSPGRIAEVQQNVLFAYQKHFSSLDAIVETLFREIEICTSVSGSGAQPPKTLPANQDQ